MEEILIGRHKYKRRLKHQWKLKQREQNEIIATQFI